MKQNKTKHELNHRSPALSLESLKISQMLIYKTISFLAVNEVDLLSLY